MPRETAGTLVAIALAGLALGATNSSFTPTDESPFVKGLDPGQRETLLYVWTRDADHKQSDFLAVVDVDPASESYGKVIATAPTNSAANEAHHFGYTVDADRIFAGGMLSNKIFIYDVETDPRNPKLIKTVDLDPSGYSGPHTLHAVPGGMLVAMLGAVGGGGPGAVILLDEEGNFKEGWPVVHPDAGPGYMYDIGVKPEMNRMITSSWSHPGHVKEGTHLEHSGKEIIIWDYEKKEILQVEEVGVAPFAVRWMHGPNALGGFTCAALSSVVSYWEDADADGRLEVHRVIELPENSVPADMRVSYDNRFLYVSLWGGGKVQQYDIADPKNPKLMNEVTLPQPNMMKLSPDSRRLYVTNSILSSLDGEVEFGAWLINVGPDGMQIDDGFKPDFKSFDGGPAGPHDMLLK